MELSGTSSRRSFYEYDKKSSKEEKVIKKMLCTKEMKLRKEREPRNE